VITRKENKRRNQPFLKRRNVDSFVRIVGSFKVVSPTHFQRSSPQEVRVRLLRHHPPANASGSVSEQHTLFDEENPKNSDHLAVMLSCQNKKHQIRITAKRFKSEGSKQPFVEKEECLLPFILLSQSRICLPQPPVTLCISQCIIFAFFRRYP
jgi:hypothetical protein